jgi:hypothetical protein
LALVALAAAGCDDDGASSDQPGAASSGDEASPAAQRWLSDLIASPDVSFEVVFREYDSTGNASYFVWRQGNGRRRWDYVPMTLEGLKAGHFSLEIDFPPRERFGDPSLGCGWSTSLAGPGEADVMCRSRGWNSSEYSPVIIALMSDVGERLPEETIAGRRASCYSLQDYSLFQERPGLKHFDSALVCLDSANGIPLRLEIDFSIKYGLNVQMSAISISLEEQELVVPVELQPDPEHPGLDLFRRFRGTVPLSSLQLPDLSQFRGTDSSLRSE